MKRKIAVVLANGEPPSRSLMEKLTRDSIFLVCTDGAANLLSQTKVIPNLIIGDLDSISDEAKSFFNEKTTIVCKESQYASDLEKALDACLDSGFDEVIVAGLKGGRVDHTLTNFAILAKYSEKLKIDYVDDEGYGLLCSKTRPSLDINTTKGTTVSLVPLVNTEGIKTSGLLYPLHNDTLGPGIREGLSNQAISNHIKLEISTGCLFVYLNENIEDFSILTD